MSAPYVRTKSQTVTVTPASITVTGKGKEVLLSSTTNCYVSFVGPAISGDALYLPANYPITIKSPFIRTVSVVRDTADGVLTVSESSNVAITQNKIFAFSGGCFLKHWVIASSSFDADSSLKREISASLDSEASLLKTISGVVSGDSSLTKVIESTLTSEASLLRTTHMSITCDANLISI